MEESNVSSGQLTFIHQQIYRRQMTAAMVTEVITALSTTVFFSFLNGIMFFILWSKPKFRESSRYILFGHMLINDSVHLISIVVLYLFALAYRHVVKAVCILLLLIAIATKNNTSLNLAVISLECYVAIRFPLHHPVIATQRRTKIIIGVIWLISSIYSAIDIFYIIVTDPNSFLTPIICIRQQILIDKWQLDLSNGLNILYCVIGAVTVIYSYVGIALAAKSACTDKDSVNKARKTMLIHLIQLGLGLLSFVYALFEAVIARTATALFLHLRFFNFFSLIIFPRCLSPLIYGLRDNAIRPLFLGYFRCNPSTVRPVLITH